MKHNGIRFLAGLLVSVALVGALALTGGMDKGARTDGLMYQASGLHPDGELLVVDGETVTCEEYLYWLDYDCQYLTYLTDIDWSAQVEENGMTYGEYVKADALEAVKLHSVIRHWAKENGVTLTGEDQAELEAQRAEYVAYYGSEEAYQQQLALVGISEAVLTANNETALLYDRLYRQFITSGTSLYPGDAFLSDYAAQQGMMTLMIVTVTGDDAEAQAQTLLERWQTASDAAAEYEVICSELGIAADGAYTLTPTLGDTFGDAVAAMAPGQFTAVLDPYGDGASYLVLCLDTDLSGVAEAYFDVALTEKRENASVVFHDALYDTIDTGVFYENLTALRSELYQSMNGETVG